jgi:hypothetical protein
MLSNLASNLSTGLVTHLILITTLIPSSNSGIRGHHCMHVWGRIGLLNYTKQKTRYDDTSTELTVPCDRAVNSSRHAIC